MSWTNLAVLGAGLGIGAIAGWLAGRSAAAGAASSGDAGSGKAATPDPPALAAELERTRLAYQMATDLAQFQAGFLARASHELRSPINSVISLHQLILSDLCDSPEEERDFVAQAYMAAEKMLALLDRLIGISKAAHGTEKLQLQPLSLKDVLLEIQQFTQLQAQNRNLRLEIAPPDSEVYVLADPRWLRQILLNLVDTPIALMQEGSVRLTTTVPNSQQVHIRIEDQRPASFWYDPVDLLQSLRAQSTQPDAGMPVTTKELVQESVAVPSAGLSLLIVQTLLDLMGGQLEVLSVPAAAPETAASPQTCIQCTLPRVLPDAV